MASIRSKQRSSPRRTQAYEAYRVMSVQAPDHFLTLQARRSLAAYDADTPSMLAYPSASWALPTRPQRSAQQAGMPARSCTARRRMALPGDVCAERGAIQFSSSSTLRN
jgi:hypothetical protein